MKVYTYTVVQTIEVSADSEEQAKELLPIYPSGFEGQAYYVSEETVDLIKESEGECDKCANSYELSSRDNRCGDCGNCGNCCTHKAGEDK